MDSLKFINCASELDPRFTINTDENINQISFTGNAFFEGPSDYALGCEVPWDFEDDEI